jgi:localization factor PodJL
MKLVSGFFVAVIGFTTLIAAAVDDPKNLENLRAQAQAGDVAAQLELGILYEYGFGMPEHMVPALAWYLRAADNGDAKAAKRRDELKAKLQPAEVDEARKQAAEFAAKEPKRAQAPSPESASAANEPPPAPVAAPPPEKSETAPASGTPTPAPPADPKQLF